MILLVLVIAVTFSQLECRRIMDDLSNEMSINPEKNFGYSSREWVKISKPPVAVMSKKVGAHMELHCEAMGSPPPTIEWYKANRKITENGAFETNVLTRGPALAEVSSRLVINHLLPRHQDVYRCVAESGTKVDTAPTKLLVTDGREMNFTQLLSAKIVGAHHLPRVTFWASTYMEVIGNDLVLPCKYVGNPKPRVTWMDPYSKVIENNEKYSVSQDGELRIGSIEWSDMGQYVCALENSAGEDSIETFLYPMKGSK
ncbi:neural/ectodermal development factor IMP-L2-like [Diabrotica virgifera virgifera]|uniref:Ig-like domain-containing protein n=2 Tax=Diabrotica virgifera virgifera TaxID=50390 RepID=A0ABM5LA08_DIAVI|nr:neural/ectodermal development factor IMP-L2-like [Diabrotica virgifera virgifera]